MAASPPPRDDGPHTAQVPDKELIELMERIKEPALLYLPGGRISAVNRAAIRLSGINAVGTTIGELLEQYGAKRANGGPLIRGDLPYTRALRGEVVNQGERIDMTMPDGSLYRAWVTSTPIVISGKVVAALSVWHDFDRYVSSLAEKQRPSGKEK